MPSPLSSIVYDSGAPTCVYSQKCDLLSNEHVSFSHWRIPKAKIIPYMQSVRARCIRIHNFIIIYRYRTCAYSVRTLHRVLFFFFFFLTGDNAQYLRAFGSWARDIVPFSILCLTLVSPHFPRVVRFAVVPRGCSRTKVVTICQLLVPNDEMRRVC